MARIILVRHGQASFGAANYDRLSSKGAAQAEHLGKVLQARGEQVDALWCGTLQRHQQTAASLLQGGEWQLEPRSLADFDEFDHQQVIARHEPRYSDHHTMMSELAAVEDPRNAFATMFGEALARWYGGSADNEYDEPWSHFQARCRRALDQVASVITRKDETHLVVTSGGVISVLAQTLLGLSDEAAMQVNWTLANASMTVLQTSLAGKHKLMSMNEHSHFRGHHQHLLTWR